MGSFNCIHHHLLKPKAFPNQNGERRRGRNRRRKWGTEFKNKTKQQKQCVVQFCQTQCWCSEPTVEKRKSNVYKQKQTISQTDGATGRESNKQEKTAEMQRQVGRRTNRYSRLGSKHILTINMHGHQIHRVMGHSAV